MSAATSMPEPPELPEVETPEAIPHGVHAAVPEHVYHGRTLGLASKSALDLVHKSPAHYRAWVDGVETPPTPAMVFGRAFHMALLEPERFARKFAAQPDFGDCRVKENKAARDEWRVAHAGKVALSHDDWSAIDGMVAAVRRHATAARLLTGGAAELTLRWHDEDYDLECKGRLDYYVESLGIAVDVKTTADASEREFARSCAKFGYHRQDAFYRRGLKALGKPFRGFVFVAIEKEPPYEPAIYMLDDAAVERGSESIEEDMATLAECLRTDTWPGYGAGIRVLSLPRWAA